MVPLDLHGQWHGYVKLLEAISGKTRVRLIDKKFNDNFQVEGRIAVNLAIQSARTFNEQEVYFFNIIITKRFVSLLDTQVHEKCA